MTTIETLLQEFELESQTTRKMLALVPSDKYSWQPHTKSMSIQKLTTHIAEIPGWLDLVFNADGLDFGSNHVEPKPISDTAALLEFYDQSFELGKRNLMKAVDSDLLPDWTMRNGDFIISTQTKGEVVRMCFCQIVHHRAQLGVYLRLLDVPIPGSYGPSADELEHQNYYTAEATA